MSGSTETARALWNALPEVIKNITLGSFIFATLLLFIIFLNVLWAFSAVKFVFGWAVAITIIVVVFWGIGAFVREFLIENDTQRFSDFNDDSDN